MQMFLNYLTVKQQKYLSVKRFNNFRLKNTSKLYTNVDTVLHVISAV